MNWITAAGTGFGLGLVYFGGLWVSVRALRFGSLSLARFTLGRLMRFAVVAVTFYALLHAGGLTAVGAGMGGVLAARWCLIRLIGRTADGR